MKVIIEVKIAGKRNIARPRRLLPTNKGKCILQGGEGFVAR